MHGDDHRRFCIVQSVKGRRKYLDRRVAGKADRVAGEGEGGHRHVRFLESSAFVDQADDRFTQDDQTARDGRVIRKTRFIDEDSVSRKSLILPSLASRESTGIAAVPTATPKSPIGNCISRNA